MAVLLRDWSCGCRAIEDAEWSHADYCPEADELYAAQEEALWLASLTGETAHEERAQKLGERIREHFRRYGPPVEEVR